jgi:hypothetical protein
MVPGLPENSTIGENMNKSIGVLLLNISTALYLLATGIIGLSGKSFKSLLNGGEIRTAVTGVIKGDFAEVVIVILAICAIAAAVFILLRLFGTTVPVAELVLVILMIVWVVFIILVDFIPLSKGRGNFVDFLRSFGAHLMVLAGISLATERFGG